MKTENSFEDGDLSFETKEFPPSTAEPPEEVVKILEKQNLPEGTIKGWYASPSLNKGDHHISLHEMRESGQVDIYKVMEPFLGQPVLDKTLRTMDLLNGCAHQCDTCLADSKHPSKMMSCDSLERLFSDEQFLKMLQPDSLRIGSSGDLLDHPQAIEILEMVLEKTKPLDRGEKHFKIKIFTNYRPNLEEKIGKLLEIAKKHPDRVNVIISTPLNRADKINSKFDDYVMNNPEIFGTGYTKAEDGLIFYGFGGQGMLKNIGINDIRHPRFLFMSGRVLADDVLDKQIGDSYSKSDRISEHDFSQRGLSKTYLNADALWLMVYATAYESHTSRVFTPMTQENFSALSRVPFHPDFPEPPNWTGGTGCKNSWPKVATMINRASASGKNIKNTTIIPITNLHKKDS